MKNYNEKTLILTPGEHVIFLQKGTNWPGYVPASTIQGRLIDNSNIIIPQVMLSARMHLEKSDYELYINTEDVLVEKVDLRQNTPGVPKAGFENALEEEVIMDPHTHEVRLPYREGVVDRDPDSQTYGKLQEIIHEYEGYEAVSPESAYEYPIGRSLWSDGDEPYVTYKLYQNTNAVAVLVKDLDKDIPGKALVKTLD